MATEQIPTTLIADDAVTTAKVADDAVTSAKIEDNVNVIGNFSSVELDFNKEEHPVAVQFGGSSPLELSKCAIMAEKKGYDEINLNIGCPSERVQKGNFGVCLMLEPDLVAECTRKMRKSVDIPVTVKCRTGVDDNDDSFNISIYFLTITFYVFASISISRFLTFC